MQIQLVDLFVTAGITIFSLGLLALSLFGYKRSKDSRMIVISLVFLFFLIKGILISLSIFFENFTFFDSLTNIWIFDFIILFLLFASSLKGK